MFLFFLGCSTSGYYIKDGYSDGQKAYERKNYSLSIKSFQQYLKKNPDSLMSELALYYLGSSYKNIGKKNKAIETYKKLISKYKSSSWVNWAKKDLQKLK